MTHSGTAIERLPRAIPSLDGLRAISVGGVVLAHLLIFDPGVPEWLAVPLSPMGAIGVRIFFVISGFLITTLLLQDLDSLCHVRLGRFYLRRILRIFPPFYVYLGTVTIIAATGWLSSGRMWPAWAYVSNIVPTGSWYTTHSWSLSVEEQFYITWPLVLTRLGRQRAAAIALGVCVAMPLVRLLATHATHSGWIGGNFSFDFLAAGCLLALAPPWVRRIIQWATARGPMIAALALALVVAEGALAHAIGWWFGVEILILQSVEAAVIAVVVAWCIANPLSIVGRVLNARPFRVIGIGSYSIYLWQQIFSTDRLSLFSPPGAIVGIAAMSAASYYLVERPSLALRSRVERWWVTRRASANSSIAA